MPEVQGKGMKRIYALLGWIDSRRLWWVGGALFVIVMVPHMLLGEGSVFTVHDQLDESMMNYVLTARHPGASVILEMLGGINASGLQPAAVLFVPLYRFLPAFWAFMASYAIVFLSGFLGMYLAVKKLTASSILAVVSGGFFCMLPVYPIYGLSQMGLPLLLYAYLCLREGKRVKTALALTVFFGLTSHLVCTGYGALGFWGLGILWRLFRKRKAGYCMAGFGVLLATYLVTNYRLFLELLLGQGNYISHREELVNGEMPFWETVWDVFQNSAQHAPSYHRGMILPIVLGLLVFGCLYHRLCAEAREDYQRALIGMAALAGIAVFYGICKSKPVVDWKNSISGSLRYFQAERLYWFYPAGWYLELALVCSVWRRQLCAAGRIHGPAALSRILLPVLALAAVGIPHADTVLRNSYFYMNMSQYINGPGVTGYISWKSFYAEELMAQLEEAIGLEPASYRVAHLGISPAPALMHGFYTVDGYSNNYPLEYKHRFRQVIGAELDKNAECAVYFDTWGSRCYLFNALTGNYWMLKKGSGIQYEGLLFDMEALRELGCRYLFSGGEISDAKRLGLTFMGYYETEDSYWGIWLYAL
ncbi:MAG: hypothetical protein HFH93_11450 [Lachnospiraceae bacterium]|nr:hypothetical protein [Lachnospiraceae bacterium]